VPPLSKIVNGVFFVHLTLMVLVLVTAPAPGMYAGKASAVAVAEQVDCTVALTAKVVLVVAALAAPNAMAPRNSVVARSISNSP